MSACATHAIATQKSAPTNSIRHSHESTSHPTQLEGTLEREDNLPSAKPPLCLLCGSLDLSTEAPDDASHTSGLKLAEHSSSPTLNLQAAKLVDATRGVPISKPTLGDPSDYAIPLPAEEAPSKYRRGSIPFLAVNLLEQKETTHKYRHDLESLFYVIAWHTLRGRDRREIAIDVRWQEWACQDREHCSAFKRAFISRKLDKPTKRFALLWSCLRGMKQALREGYNAKGDFEECETAEEQGYNLPQFDDDTLNGCVSFATFKKILNTPLQ